MSLSAGTAVAYLTLDHSGYTNGLANAKQQLATFVNDTENAGTRISALGGAITGVGNTLTKTLTVPLVAVGAAATKVAVDFEAGMSRVKALSGATGEDFEKLKKQAVELGSATSFSASEAAEGMQNLASAGFSVNEIMSAMPGLLDLAASDNIDLASAAEIASSTLRGFGLEATQASHVADVLAKAAADTNAGILDTGEAMKYIAPVAAAMGLSLEEVTAAIGEMSNAGIKGGQAGTALRASLTRLANPSSEAADLMESLGFNAYDSSGKMLSLKDIISNLGTSMNGLSEEQKQQAIATIFGQEAMSGMLTLIQAGPQELEKLTKSFENSNGAAKEMADTMMDNTKGAWDEFTSALEGAGIAIGNKLLPILTKGINKITDMVNSFNSLSEETQGTIVKIGAMVAAIGPMLIIGGKLISSIGSIVSAVNIVNGAIGGAGMTGLISGLSAVAVPLIATLAAVGAGFYVWHEANDVANQSITKSREEMSWMEKVIADLTGQVTYSRKELEDMGLVYKDFNENISEGFQESVKSMTTDIHDFGMRLGEISLDDVISAEEHDEFVKRVDTVLNSALEAIDTKSSEMQDGLKNAFALDGVIDENETALVEWWANRGIKEKEEAQKLQSEINEIESAAFAAGRDLTPDEIAAIEKRYAQIRQIELEAQASNNYEIEYAHQEFQNRMMSLDTEEASKLLQERANQRDEEQIQIRTNYDTLIAMAKENYDALSEEQRVQVDDTISRLEEAKQRELDTSQGYYDQDYQYAIDHNEKLKEVINKYNGEKLAAKDVEYYNELVQANDHYQNLQTVTESGYQKMYNTATSSWDDLYVKVNETTGQLEGVYDLNTQKIGAMTKDNADYLNDEVAAWTETAEGILINCIMIGNAYTDTEGNIRDASNNIIGKIKQVEDENGNLVQSIVDVNGNPIKIGDNTQDVINKLQNTQREVNNTNGKKANIEVTDNGTAQRVANSISNIPSFRQVVVGVQYNESNRPSWNGSTMYATGTDNALSGVASVAEYAPELISLNNGGIMLATNPMLMNMQGGETVYNARQTQEILNNMNTNNVESSKLDKLINQIVELRKDISKKNFSNITNNNLKVDKVEANGIADIRDLAEQLTEYTNLRTI